MRTQTKRECRGFTTSSLDRPDIHGCVGESGPQDRSNVIHLSGGWPESASGHGFWRKLSAAVPRLSRLPRRIPVTIMLADTDVRSVSRVRLDQSRTHFVYRMHIWCLILRLVTVLPLAPDGVSVSGNTSPRRCQCHGSEGERYTKTT